MARPPIERRVRPDLRRWVFKPDGVPSRELAHAILSLDEAEAIRLADLEGLYQEVAARRMGISRQTFGRIIESAHRTIADAIINRKSLRIEGGEVVMREQEESMMKIAVPARQGLVDAHFGHCDHFMVFGLDEERRIIEEHRVDSPDGCGCKSNIAGVLARMGVTDMVAGSMGEGAVRVLQAHGISVVRGASGEARQAAEMFAAGKLADSGEACVEHGGSPGHRHGSED